MNEEINVHSIMFMLDAYFIVYKDRVEQLLASYIYQIFSKTSTGEEFDLLCSDGQLVFIYQTIRHTI